VAVVQRGRLGVQATLVDHKSSLADGSDAGKGDGRAQRRIVFQLPLANFALITAAARHM
jgi:hypothetical protein